MIVTKCYCIIIDDGKKSNHVLFKTSENGWNYWFKVIPKHLDVYNVPHAMNIKLILQIEYNLKYKYFAYGDIHSIDVAKKSENYHNNKKYDDFLDSFDRDKPLQNRKWIQITDETLLESIVVVHKHISHMSNDFRINLQQHMSNEYSIHIQNNHSAFPIPCGPILKCNIHNVAYCRECKRNNKKLRSSWWCNTKQTTNGQNIYLIWDANNGWLPGLWNNIHPQLRNKYLIQSKPPQ